MNSNSKYLNKIWLWPIGEVKKAASYPPRLCSCIAFLLGLGKVPVALSSRLLTGPSKYTLTIRNSPRIESEIIRSVAYRDGADGARTSFFLYVYSKAVRVHNSDTHELYLILRRTLAAGKPIKPLTIMSLA